MPGAKVRVDNTGGPGKPADPAAAPKP